MGSFHRESTAAPTQVFQFATKLKVQQLIVRSGLLLPVQTSEKMPVGERQQKMLICCSAQTDSDLNRHQHACAAETDLFYSPRIPAMNHTDKFVLSVLVIYL